MMKRLSKFVCSTKCLFFEHSGEKFWGTIFSGLLITLRTNTQYIAPLREETFFLSRTYSTILKQKKLSPTACEQMKSELNHFSPHPLLKGPHRMTLTPRWWPRPGLLQHTPIEERMFEVEPGSRVLTKCHWQSSPNLYPTILLVHGLEGCTESHYMRGIAHASQLDHS